MNAARPSSVILVLSSLDSLGMVGVRRLWTGTDVSRAGGSAISLVPFLALEEAGSVLSFLEAIF